MVFYPTEGLLFPFFSVEEVIFSKKLPKVSDEHGSGDDPVGKNSGVGINYSINKRCISIYVVFDLVRDGIRPTADSRRSGTYKVRK